jgi:hypothetical protein
MNDDSPIQLVTTKPDKELAADLKEELVSAADAWLQACTKAHKSGFIVSANFGPNYLGVYVIQQLSLSKIF